MTALGFRTTGTSALITHLFVDEQYAMPFDDNQRIIENLHKQLGEDEALIEVGNGITKSGKPYVFDIIKHHRVEKDGTFSQFGMEYTVNLNVKGDEVIHFVNGSFQEEDTTGIRESIILAWYCNANDCDTETALENWFADPYDDTIQKGFLTRSFSINYRI